MSDQVALALDLARGLRQSRGYQELDPTTRASFDRDLSRLEGALSRDPYSAQALGVFDMTAKLQASARQPAQSQTPLQAATSPPPSALPSQTTEIGRRAADALESVNFPGFVAALITGTFQAIVDSSAQQIRRYAELVQSITESLEQFSAENVSPNQARDELAQKYPKDLVVRFPAPGTGGQPKLVPTSDSEGESPEWLARYGLAGQELTEELTEGPLLEHGRLRVGEDRLQTLATMVLMGINRIVVSEGDIRAKLRFHASADDILKADVDSQSLAIANRSVNSAQGMQMMVSTVKANVQAEASIKADLLGEVRVAFRSETFPLERFADSQAIQLLNRHAKWKGNDNVKAQPAQAPVVAINNTTTAAPVSPPAAPGGNTGGERT